MKPPHVVRRAHEEDAPRRPRTRAKRETRAPASDAGARQQTHARCDRQLARSHRGVTATDGGDDAASSILR